MGLFDDMRCEYLLPEGFEDVQNYRFQTKSFDNPYMRFITITEDGKLIAREIDNMDLSDFHGDVYFYGGDDKKRMANGFPSTETWVEFRARFSNGKLDNIINIPE